VIAETGLAQVSASTETPAVVLVKLAPPIYPPLARQASITGEVKVQLRIRKDGGVDSAEAVSGHAMLKLAALATLSVSSKIQ
jgi:outer membrane biosynthesis protein TonB